MKFFSIRRKRGQGRRLSRSVALSTGVVVVVILVALLLAGFTSEGREQVLQPQQEAVMKVQTAKVVVSKLLQDLNSFGTISYSKKNDVTLQVEGVLQQLLVKEGDKVVRGQILARLENIQLEIQRQQGENAVNSALAGLEMATTRLQEGRLMVESSLLDLEKLELQMIQQQLELEEARMELEKQEKLLELGGVTAAAYRSQQVALEGLEASYKMALKEYQSRSLGFRDQDLVEQGIVPDSDPTRRRLQLVELNTRTLVAELDSAKAAVEGAQKNLSSLNELISHLVIRSPRDGVVAARYFEEGEFLPEKEKLFTIIDVSQVHAVFSIQEQDISCFTIGSPVEVEIPALGISVNAPVQEISSMADPQSGNFTLKSYIENKQDNIKPGMFVKCRIPRESVYHPSIPESALLSSVSLTTAAFPASTSNLPGEFLTEETGQVFVVHQGRAIKKEVQLVGRADGILWISQGLEEGEVVVDNPSPFLKEGQHVEHED